MKFRSYTPFLATALLAAGLVGPAFAQGYPNPPDQLLSVYQPVGGTDQLAPDRRAENVQNMGQANRRRTTVPAAKRWSRPRRWCALPPRLHADHANDNLAANPTLYKGKITFDTMKDLVPVRSSPAIPHVARRQSIGALNT